MNSHTAQLATFAAHLRFDAIPESVVRKTEDLLVDWFGSAVAGQGSRPVESITRFALAMGPQAAPGCDIPAAGPSEVIINRVGPARIWRPWPTPRPRMWPSRTTCTTARCSTRPRWCSRRRWRWRRPSAPAARELLAACGGGLRGGHPRRRVPRPLALQGVPHHRHRGHAGRGGGRGQPAGAGRRRRCSTPSARPARSPRGCGSSCATAADQQAVAHGARRRRGPDVGLPGAETASPARAQILEGPQGMAAGMSQRRRPRATDRRPGHALGHRRDLVQVPRLVPPHAPGGRCAAAA